MRSDRPIEGIAYSLRLIRSAGNQKHFPRTHNRSDAHGQRLMRNIFLPFKQSGVRINRTLGQIDQMRSLRKVLRRLIKTNVPVAPDPEKLKINAAQIRYQFIITFAFFFYAPGNTVRNIRICLVNIDMVKQIVVHEIAVALIMGSRKAAILIQISGFYPGKIKQAIFIPPDQFSVSPDRGGPGRQSQHTIRFQNNNGRNDGGCLLTQFFVIFFLIDFYHTVLPFQMSLQISSIPYPPVRK